MIYVVTKNKPLLISRRFSVSILTLTSKQLAESALVVLKQFPLNQT